MRIFAICNSGQLGLPILARLKELDLLVGVSFMERFRNELVPSFTAMGVEEEQLFPLKKDDWEASLEKTLLKLKPDCVFVLTFSWKVPANLLKIPPKGFVNFHFGLLPKYKGADPIFWQIKHQEKEGGITVHLMNEAIDEGPVILQDKIPMMGGENYGLHCNQLAAASSGWVDNVLEKIKLSPINFVQLDSAETAPERQPNETDLTIDWSSQTAHEIECLVNASNPRYGGARTTFSGQPLRILEVTPMDVTEEMKGIAGEIVYADLTYGVIVSCADGECIRITIAQISGSYVSGVKLTNFGFWKGAKFQ